jgi:hypothetical protein
MLRIRSSKIEAELNYQVCKVCINLEKNLLSIPGGCGMRCQGVAAVVAAVETDTPKS